MSNCTVFHTHVKNDRLMAFACTLSFRFSTRDRENMRFVLRFSSSVLDNTLAFQRELNLKKQNQVLLQIAKNLFSNLSKCWIKFTCNVHTYRCQACAHCITLLYHWHDKGRIQCAVVWDSERLLVHIAGDLEHLLQQIMNAARSLINAEQWVSTRHVASILQSLIYSCGTILGPVRSFSNITIPLPSDAQCSYWTSTLGSWWPRFLMEDCQTNRKLSVSRLGKELLATWQKQARHDKESRHDCTRLYLCLCLFYVIQDALLFVSQLIMIYILPGVHSWYYVYVYRPSDGSFAPLLTPCRHSGEHLWCVPAPQILPAGGQEHRIPHKKYPLFPHHARAGSCGRGSALQQN